MDYLISVIESFRLAWLETSFYFIKNTIMPIPRITDADFAQETSELAKNQILNQASMAMLSQANQSKQNVLQLLG